MQEIHDLMARIAALEARLHYLVMPSLQLEDTTETATATTRFQGTAGAIKSDVPVQQQYGYWSRPLPGALHTVAHIGGHAGRGISIAANDERYRPQTMAPGDVQIGDSSKQSIWLSSGSTISITSAGIVHITAPTKVTITSPLTELSGNLTVNGTGTFTGDVTAAGISLDHHEHTGVQSGGGTSGPPIPPQ